MDIFQDPPDYSYVYTRANAIEDGYLVDVSETAQEAGFKVPVAITCAVWADCVAWDDETGERKGVPQDEAGRLWDVVYMASLTARKRGDDSRRHFEVYRVPPDGQEIEPVVVELAMDIGPGDNHEPVITISFPEED